MKFKEIGLIRSYKMKKIKKSIFFGAEKFYNLLLDNYYLYSSLLQQKY
jgi:hypothetical protein